MLAIKKFDVKEYKTISKRNNKNYLYFDESVTDYIYLTESRNFKSNIYFIISDILTEKLEKCFNFKSKQHET